MPWALKKNSNDGLRKSICNLALHPLKTLYLYYRNV